MRITVHLPDNLAKDIKTLAGNKKKSVSSMTAEALKQYIRGEEKKKAFQQVRELIGKTEVSSEIYHELKEERSGRYDRG